MAERRERRGAGRRRERKNVPSGNAYIQSSFTLVTITDPDGNALAWASPPRRLQGFAQHALRGRAGRGLGRAEGHGARGAPGERVCARRSSGRERGDSLAPGRPPTIASIVDRTPIPHNGCGPEEAPSLRSINGTVLPAPSVGSVADTG